MGYLWGLNEMVNVPLKEIEEFVVRADKHVYGWHKQNRSYYSVTFFFFKEMAREAK